jgi:hypothetical protein
MRRLSSAGMTFVTFARGKRGDAAAAGVIFSRTFVTFARNRAVPCAGEIGMARPLAQPVGALAAHPGRRRGARHAARLVQRADELHLPVDGPAVPADAAGARRG